MCELVYQTTMPKPVEIEGPFVTQEATKVAHIRKGCKELTLEINPLTGTAATYLESLPDKQDMPGETTSVYCAAKKIMQDEAKNCSGGEIKYVLETGFPRMRDWTMGPGREIFHWDRVCRTVDDPEKIRAYVVIHPSSGGTGEL
jgi:hypothetical protein